MKRLLIGLGLFTCTTLGIILAPGASANHPLTLSPNPNGWVQTVPTPIYNQMRNSNHGVDHPAYFQWLSPESNSAATSMTVNYSQNEVNLRLNLAGVISKLPNQVVRAKYRVTDVSGGGPQGNSQGQGSFRAGGGNVVGQERTLVFEPNQSQLGRYAYENITFQFSPGDPDGAGPLNGFVREGTYNITVVTKLIARFKRSDGSLVHRCVPSGGEVPSIDHHHLCPTTGWPFQIQIDVGPPPNYDNRSLLRLCSGSPVNNEVVAGGEYRLCARSTNVGSQPTLGIHTLAVRNQNPGLVSDAGIENLNPGGNRFTNGFGVDKAYLGTPTADCSPDQGSNQRCWFWYFQDVLANNEVNSSYYFRVNSSAAPGSTVCFQPFVRRRLPPPGGLYHEGNQMCFTVTDPNCPVGTDYAGQPIDGQPDRNGDGTINAADCNNPPKKPYLKVFGNDVVAGGGFGEICSALNSGADIQAFSRSEIIGPDTHWKGASTQFGAFALGGVNDFISAGLRPYNGTHPRPPMGLTFGNSNNGASILPMNQGGDSGTTNCITDYYAEPTKVVQSNNNIPNGTVPATVPQGTRQAYYFNGDVRINGTGITYQNSETGQTWGTSVENIPSLFIIVRGNIYIDPSVSRLDGIYVAQPDPTRPGSGVINTCTTNGTMLGLGACNTKLTVNGAFIARQVRFMRTGGDLAVAPTSEQASSANIAEVFNFSPEVYLGPLHPTLNRSVPFTKYDYITSLPPVL